MLTKLVNFSVLLIVLFLRDQTHCVSPSLCKRVGYVGEEQYSEFNIKDSQVSTYNNVPYYRFSDITQDKPMFDFSNNPNSPRNGRTAKPMAFLEIRKIGLSKTAFVSATAIAKIFPENRKAARGDLSRDTPRYRTPEINLFSSYGCHGCRSQF